MLIKSELDNRAAIALGLPVKRVSVITEAFIEELCNAITESGGFSLVGLGKLRVKFERGNNKITPEGPAGPMRIKLYFSKSLLLKKQIERKYGLSKEPSDEQAK